MSLLTLQDMHVDVVAEVEVEVRPVFVVEVAGVGPAVRHPGPLYEQLRHRGGPAGHHDGADPAPGAGELDTLAEKERELVRSSGKPPANHPLPTTTTQPKFSQLHLHLLNIANIILDNLAEFIVGIS